MAGILKRKLLLDGRDVDNLGYVNSVDEAYKLIAEFETESKTKFSCLKPDKGFGNTGRYIYIYSKVLSDECLGAKLRVIENRCVLFNSLTYVYLALLPQH